jgi:predicted phosphoribosyltransferase
MLYQNFVMIIPHSHLRELLAKEFEKLQVKLICVLVPAQFWAVGQFYWDFDQISDDEVAEILGSNVVHH